MASRGLDVAGAVAMDEGNGEIAAGRQNLWGVAGAQTRAVFSKADIAHIMGAIFDTPVPSVEREQVLRTRFGRSKGRDEIDDLGGGGASFGHAAGELGHLPEMRPGGSQIGIHLGADLDAAYLGASPSTVDGLGLHVLGVWIGKIE